MSTPQRRLTRANTRQSQTPAPSQVSGTRRGKSRRSEVSPLPAVPVGDSYAYGSAGRVHIDSQVQSTAGNVFTSAFGANRGSAVNRDAPTPARSRQTSLAPSVASRTSPRKSQPVPVVADTIRVAQSILEDDEEDEEDEIDDEPELPITNNAELDSEEDEDFQDEADDLVHTPIFRRASPTRKKDFSFTEVDSDFSYVAPQRSYITTKNSILSARAPSPIRPSPTRSSLPMPPSPTNALFATRDAVRRWVRDNAGPIRGFFMITLGLVLSGLLFRYIPQLNITGTFQALVDSITSQVEHARNATTHNTLFDPNLYGRIDKVESDVSDLRIQWKQYRNVLPEQIAVTKDAKTGDIIVPSAFYNAFVSKLSADDTFSPGASGAWSSFVTSNTAKINSLISASADSHLTSLIKSGTIISRSAFISELETQSNKVLDKARSDLSTFRLANDKQIKKIATTVANDIVSRRQSSKGQTIEDITLLCLAQNIDIRAQRNYFNPYIGASVDVRLSSPTAKRQQPSTMAWLLADYNPFSSVIQENPHLTALHDWTEAGQAWCAATSTPRGRAQLSIQLSRAVRPRTLVIEHAPSTATWDILAAPKEVEVWGQVVPLAVEQRRHTQPTDPNVASGSCESAPPSTSGEWVCLGSGAYDMHAVNYMQSVSLDDNIEGKMVGKVVVRVKTNWGGERTCLYRLRLLGDSEEEVMDELQRGM